MSDAPTFAKGRDLDETAAALGAWLAPRLGGDVEVGAFEYPKGAGVSNETLLFEAHTTQECLELVLRPAPRPEYQLFHDTGFELQHAILDALHRRGTVRVPEPLWFEDDPSILGMPFFIMRRIRGRVPVSMPVYNASGWVLDATPAERRRLWLSAVEQLVAINSVPADDVLFADRPQIEWWWGQAMWAFGGEVPDAYHTLFGWLRDNRPIERRVLSWGDARMGNMVFDDDYDVVAVLDWEQVNLDGGASDLGWWLFFDEMHSVEQGLRRLDGLGSRQETIDLWEEGTGMSAADVRWHEVFAGIKTSLIVARGLRLPNAPAGDDRIDPYLPKVHRLLGWA